RRHSSTAKVLIEGTSAISTPCRERSKLTCRGSAGSATTLKAYMPPRSGAVPGYSSWPRRWAEARPEQSHLPQGISSECTSRPAPIPRLDRHDARDRALAEAARNRHGWPRPRGATLGGMTYIWHQGGRMRAGRHEDKLLWIWTRRTTKRPGGW